MGGLEPRTSHLHSLPPYHQSIPPQKQEKKPACNKPVSSKPTWLDMAKLLFQFTWFSLSFHPWGMLFLFSIIFRKSWSYVSYSITIIWRTISSVHYFGIYVTQEAAQVHSALMKAPFITTQGNHNIAVRRKRKGPQETKVLYFLEWRIGPSLCLPWQRFMYKTTNFYFKENIH